MSNPFWLPVLSVLCSKEFYKCVRNPDLAKAVLVKYGLNWTTCDLLLALSDSKGCRFLLNYVEGVDWQLPIGVGPKVITSWLESYTGQDADITLADRWLLGDQISMLSDSSCLDKIRSLVIEHKPLCGPESYIDPALGKGFQKLVPHLQKTDVGKSVIREYALELIEHPRGHIEDQWVLDWAASPRGNLTPKQEEVIFQSHRHLIPRPDTLLPLLKGTISDRLTVSLLNDVSYIVDGALVSREEFLWYSSILAQHSDDVISLLAATTSKWTCAHQRLALAFRLSNPTLLRDESDGIGFNKVRVACWLSCAHNELFHIIETAPESAFTRILNLRILEVALESEDWEMVAKFIQLPCEPYVSISKKEQIDYLAASHPSWCTRQWFYIPPSTECLSSLHRRGLLYRAVIPGPGTYPNVGMVLDWLLLNLSEKKCAKISDQLLAMARFVAKGNCGLNPEPLDHLLRF